MQIGSLPTKKHIYPRMIMLVSLLFQLNHDVDDAPFDMYMKVASDFRWGDIPEEKIDDLLQINAPALLMGYLRPIVANVTNFSEYPSYNIPFVDFTEDTNYQM